MLQVRCHLDLLQSSRQVICRAKEQQAAHQQLAQQRHAAAATEQALRSSLEEATDEVIDLGRELRMSHARLQELEGQLNRWACPFSPLPSHKSFLRGVAGGHCAQAIAVPSTGQSTPRSVPDAGCKLVWLFNKGWNFLCSRQPSLRHAHWRTCPSAQSHSSTRS